MICSFFSSRSRMPSSSFRLNIPLLPSFSSSRISMISTCGSMLPEAARCFSRNMEYFRSIAVLNVFRDGVADPSTTPALASSPLFTAASTALYRGTESDMYAPSCSSSTMIMPRSGNGANSADLGPIMIEISPLRARSKHSYFSPADSFE